MSTSVLNVLLLLEASCGGHVVYVAPDADGSGDGSILRPFTLSGAKHHLRMNQAAGATVILRGGDYMLGGCNAYSPYGCNHRGGYKGYASSDIFYLEICILSQICRNGWKLFRLNQLEEFHCDLRDTSAKFSELGEIVVDTVPEQA